MLKNLSCRNVGFKFAASLLAVLYLAMPMPAHAGVQAGITPIVGNPWVWFVGDDDSYQTVPTANGMPGEFYPSNVTYPPPSSTADLGWIVVAGGNYVGPDFDAHLAGTYAGGVFGDLGSAYFPLHATSVSGVTGTGTATDPYQVEQTTPFGVVPLTKVTRVRYVDGTDYATYEIAITNTGSMAQTAAIYFAGGFPAGYAAAYDAASGTVGVQQCGTPSPILGFKPLNPADFYSVTQNVNPVWLEIAFDPQLDDMVSPDDCPSSSTATAGLQWNRSIAPGETAVIQVAVSIFASVLPNPFDLTAVMPSSGMQGETVDASIDGNAFLDSTTFDFGPGITVTDTTISSAFNASVTLNIDPSATVGSRDITATQASGGEQVVLTSDFNVTAAAAPLSITSLVPDNGDPGAGYTGPELQVTVTGTGFTSNLDFDFGAGITLSGVLVQDSTTAITYLLIDPAAAPGPRDVVANQAGINATLTDGFTVNAPPTPLTLTGISPNSGEAGTSGLAVTLTGSGFEGPQLVMHRPNGTLSIDFGPDITVSNLVVQSDSTATANIAIVGTATTGPRDVTATFGLDSSTLTNGFTVDPMVIPLSLISVAPSAGTAGDSNLAVTVTGEGFNSALSLDFGPDITVSNLMVQSSTSASVNLAIGSTAATGPRDVSAMQGQETSTLPNGFTVNAMVIPLSLTGVNPAFGTVGDTSLPVTISGAGFTSGLAFDFGANISVSNLVVQSSNSATANLAIGAAAATGPRDVNATQAMDSAILPNGFTVNPATPTGFDLTNVSPSQGTQGATQIATITGDGFGQSTMFDFGSRILVSNVTIYDSQSARVFLTIAANAPLGNRTVTATQAPGGASASLADAFEVVAPPPPPVPGTGGTLVFSLSASTSGPLGTGDAFAYTIGLRNFTDTDVGAITVADALPYNLTVTVTDCQGGSIVDGRLTWVLDGLAAGEAATCELSAQITTIDSTGEIVDTATATYFGSGDQIVTLNGRAVVSTFDLPQVESQTLGGEPTTENSVEPALSADGSVVVFSSKQGDLVPLDANSGGADIFLRDRRSGETRLISQGIGGLQLMGNSVTPDISLNGQAAAFILQSANAQSTSKDTAADDGAGQLCSSQPNSLFQMDCDDTGMDGEPLDGMVEEPTLSANGKLLAFCSDASNWVADDTNGAKDVFVKDQTSGVVTRVSVDPDGTQADGASCDPMISADGKFVAFTSNAPSLGGTPGARQVIRTNIETGEMIVVTAPGGISADADAGRPSISTDGSRIAFTSPATNLVPGADDGQNNLFVWKTPGGGSSRSLAKDDSAGSLFVMRTPDDELPNGNSEDPKIACTGSAVGFTSDASNLVDEDGNGLRDFFIYDLDSGMIVRPGSAAAGEPNGNQDNAALDCEATAGAYDSTATGPGNPNPNSDVLSQEDPLRDGTGSIVLGSSFSGNWFDPDQSGQGFLLEALPDGDFYATWYTYSNGEPLFLQGLATPVGSTLNVTMYSAQSTGFPVGTGGAESNEWGTVMLSFTSSNDGKATWTPTAGGFSSGSMNLHRLSRAALVQSNRDGEVDACNSGVWFDPLQSGYGFNIEINDLANGNRIATAYWYTYQPDGSPLWLVGTGLAQSTGISMDLYRFSGDGAQFPPAFSADALSPGKWGTATLRFASGALDVSYASMQPGYGSGDLALQRLTALKARTCSD